MNTPSLTQLYDHLTTRLGKENAEILSNYMDTKFNHELGNTVQRLPTKEDLAKTEVKMVRWMFIFWISQVAATLSFISLLLNK